MQKYGSGDFKKIVEKNHFRDLGIFMISFFTFLLSNSIDLCTHLSLGARCAALIFACCPVDDGIAVSFPCFRVGDLFR